MKTKIIIGLLIVISALLLILTAKQTVSDAQADSLQLLESSPLPHK